MKEFRKFEEAYNQGYKKGYIAGIEDSEEKEYLRPDDYCPLTTPISDIMEIPCMNCPIEDKCDFGKSSKMVSSNEFWGEDNLDCPNLNDEDFDDDECEIQLLYDTEKIERFQGIIEEASMLNGHIIYMKSKYFQDKDLIMSLDGIRDKAHNIIEKLRELQEEAAIDEMYEFLVKNY